MPPGTVGLSPALLLLSVSLVVLAGGISMAMMVVSTDEALDGIQEVTHSGLQQCFEHAEGDLTRTAQWYMESLLGKVHSGLVEYLVLPKTLASLLSTRIATIANEESLRSAVWDGYMFGHPLGVLEVFARHGPIGNISYSYLEHPLTEGNQPGAFKYTMGIRGVDASGYSLGMASDSGILRAQSSERTVDCGFEAPLHSNGRIPPRTLCLIEYSQPSDPVGEWSPVHLFGGRSSVTYFVKSTAGDVSVTLDLRFASRKVFDVALPDGAFMYLVQQDTRSLGVIRVAGATLHSTTPVSVMPWERTEATEAIDSPLKPIQAHARHVMGSPGQYEGLDAFALWTSDGDKYWVAKTRVDDGSMTMYLLLAIPQDEVVHNITTSVIDEVSSRVRSVMRQRTADFGRAAVIVSVCLVVMLGVGCLVSHNISGSLKRVTEDIHSLASLHTDLPPRPRSYIREVHQMQTSVELMKNHITELKSFLPTGIESNDEKHSEGPDVGEGGDALEASFGEVDPGPIVHISPHPSPRPLLPNSKSTGAIHASPNPGNLPMPASFMKRRPSVGLSPVPTAATASPSKGFEALKLGLTKQVEVVIMKVRLVWRSKAVASPERQGVVFSRFVEMVADAVDHEHGVVEQIEGVDVLASFNMTKRCAARHQAACLAALEVCDLVGSLQYMAEDALEIVCGLSEGVALSGNLGTSERRWRACIGNAVMEADRLVTVGQIHGLSVVTTARLARVAAFDKRLFLRQVDVVQLLEPAGIPVYQVLSVEQAKTSYAGETTMHKDLALADEGWQLLARGQAGKGLERFAEYMARNPYDLVAHGMMKRVQTFHERFGTDHPYATQIFTYLRFADPRTELTHDQRRMVALPSPHSLSPGAAAIPSAMLLTRVSLPESTHDVGRRLSHEPSPRDKTNPGYVEAKRVSCEYTWKQPCYDFSPVTPYTDSRRTTSERIISMQQEVREEGLIRKSSGRGSAVATSTATSDDDQIRFELQSPSPREEKKPQTVNPSPSPVPGLVLPGRMRAIGSPPVVDEPSPCNYPLTPPTARGGLTLQSIPSLGNGPFSDGSVLQHTAERTYETKEVVYMVLQLSIGPRSPPLQEMQRLLTSFTSSVVMSGGVVEYVSTERWVARWMSSDPSDTSGMTLSAALCAKATLELHQSCGGVGLAAGTSDCAFCSTRVGAGVYTVLGNVLSKAEALAHMSYASGLGVVAEAVFHTSDNPDSSSPILWRPLITNALFEFGDHTSSSEKGLVEMVKASPNVYYMRALYHIEAMTWFKAKEMLQQAIDLDSTDAWAMSLHAAVKKAESEEAAGIRQADEPLTIVITKASMTFQQADSLELSSAALPSPAHSSRNLTAFGRSVSLANKMRGLRKTKKSSGVTIQQVPSESSSTTTDDEEPYVAVPSEQPLDIQRLRDRRVVRRLLGLVGNDNLGDIVEEPQPLWHIIAKWWNPLRLAALMYNCFMIPTRAAFEPPSDEWTSTQIVLVVVDYMLDLVYYGDILLNFREPVTDAEGYRVFDPALLTKMYLKGWFSIDVAGCLPWELLWFAADPSVLLRHRWLRFNRCLNLLRLPDLISTIVDDFFPDAHPIRVRITMLLGVLAYALYWLGCVWGVTLLTLGSTDTRFGSPTYGWPEADAYLKMKGFSNTSIQYKALHGFHWAVRGFAGYGMPWPVTDDQHLICTFTVVIGIGIFATVIAYMQSLLRMTQDEAFCEHLDQLVNVCQQKRVDHRIIIQYYRRLWAQTRQAWPGQFDSLREELPQELVLELWYFTNFRIIERIKVLQGSGDPSFITKIVSLMHNMFAAPGEHLLQRGDQQEGGCGVYFLYTGSAEARIGDEVIEHLRAGDFWGEISCLFEVPQVADLVILEYSEVYFLPLQGFKILLDDYPVYISAFSAAAFRRREAVRRKADEAKFRKDSLVSQVNDEPTIRRIHSRRASIAVMEEFKNRLTDLTASDCETTVFTPELGKADVYRTITNSRHPSADSASTSPRWSYDE